VQKLFMAIGLLLVAAVVCPAQVTLNFNSLPSAQGWTYTTSGPAESSFGVGQTTPIFSVDGTTLHQNTIGTGLGPGGAAFEYYIRYGAVDPTKPFILDVRSRVLQSQHLDSGGFNFGVFTGTEIFEIFMDTSTIQDAFQTTIAVIDNTFFHDYRLEATPGVGYKLFVDGTLVATGPPSAAASLPNQLFIGDGTSGGNAKADLTFYRFSEAYNVCLLYDPTKAAKSGSTIPIKLQLCDGSGGQDLSSSSITAHAVSITQVSSLISGAVQDSGNANPDNDFRFDSSLGNTGGYIFNLSTSGLTTGTYNLNFTVTGDLFVYSAPFQVK